MQTAVLYAFVGVVFEGVRIDGDPDLNLRNQRILP